MYNIMGIWPTDQEVLSHKPIATLRHKWNEIKNEMKLKMKLNEMTTEGETKEVMTLS